MKIEEIANIRIGQKLKYIGDDTKRKGRTYVVVGQMHNDIILHDADLLIEGSGKHKLHFVAKMKDLERIEVDQ